MKQGACAVKAALAVLCVLAALGLAGCISARSDVTYGPKGPPVGDCTLRQIECGQTSGQWLRTVLGEPTREDRLPDGTELLTYEYTRKVDTDFDLFLLLDIDDKHEEHTTYVFELQDGIVTEYWKE